MSIYRSLTDSFLVKRELLPEPKWDDRIHAFVDEQFEDAALSVYSNPDVLEDFNKSEYITKIDDSLEKIYGSVGRGYPEAFPLTSMILELDFDFPLINVFGMALADGNKEKIGKTWTHCTHVLYHEFSKSMLSTPSKSNTLRLSRLIDLIYEFEGVMIDLEFFSSNYVPLTGIDYWFGDVTNLVNKYLKHADILNLSNAAGMPTLVSMHSSVPTARWLGDEFSRGESFLTNNPNLPSDVVNKALSERELGTSDKLLFHPNANTEEAINWVIELLNSGKGEDLLDTLREWDNVSDDLFNNFNSFRSASKSGKKVILAIKKWCENNPDSGQEIYEMLFGEEI